MSGSIEFESVVQSIAKQAGVEGDLKCGICAQFVRGLASACGECHALYHQDCWKYNGGCAVYGCRAVPPGPQPVLEVRRVTGSRARTALIALGAVTCVLFGISFGFWAGHAEGIRTAELAAEAEEIEMSIEEAEMMHAMLMRGDVPGLGAPMLMPPPMMPGMRPRGACGPCGPAQVLVEAMIAETDEATAVELGLEGARSVRAGTMLRAALMERERAGKARVMAMPLVMAQDGNDVMVEIGEMGGAASPLGMKMKITPEIERGQPVRLTTQIDLVDGQAAGERASVNVVVEAEDGQEQAVGCLPLPGGKRLIVLMAPHVM
jgi:hypothetical protein